MATIKMNSRFKKSLQAKSKVAESALKDTALKSKFLVGSHNSVRLKKSLRITKDLHLLSSTLLTPEIHTAHAKSLAKRFIKRYETVLKSAKNKEQDASEKFKFLTLIDCVQVLNAEKAMASIRALKETLINCVKTTSGAWCLGAIEVEVISIDLMRKLSDNSKKSEERKLDVCEELLKKLKRKDQTQSSYFLIHFHGIVNAKNEGIFNDFLKNIENIKQWNIAPRQIQLKGLSKEYAGTAKSVENNLKDIARYITKGGNDWSGNKAYLRFKQDFENEALDTEDSWVNKNWRRNEVLRKEHKEDGIEDYFSLSPEEISELATVIDSMMKLNKRKTGYLAYAQGSRKLSTTG